MLVSKINLLVGATKTEANQVLGSPLTISTRKVEPTISKAMVSKEVSVLAKSFFLKRERKPDLTKGSSYRNSSQTLLNTFKREENKWLGVVLFLGFSIKTFL